MPEDAKSVIAGARAYVLDGSMGMLPLELRRSGGAGVTELAAEAPAGSGTVMVTLPCGAHEHFAGFFEQFTQLDKRGRVINGRLHASVNQGPSLAPGLDGGYKIAPVFYSSAGYGAVLHSDARWRIELAVRDPHLVVIQVPGSSIRLSIAPGAPKQALEAITGIIGRPPLAPPWAYGVWKAMRGGSESVLAQAARLRADGVPASAIWLDAHYQPETNSGFPAAGSYEMGEYPDMAATVGALHEVGFKVLTYVNPCLYKNTPVHDEAVKLGYALKDASGEPIHTTSLHPFEGDYLGVLAETGIHSGPDAAAVVDFTNPEAVAWWQELLRKILLEEGFDGWMEDFGEGVPANAAPADGSSVEELANRYPVLYHRAAAEAQRRYKPNSLFFARGGWTGAQAHAPVFWPGDQTRDWSSVAGLASLVPAGISAGLMGVAAWGPDIGGNMGFPSLGGGYGGGSEDRELWMRWCQLGAMTPVMRDHLSFHSGTPVDMWTDEGTIACWRDSARWHLALFPYLYSLAHEASRTGVPVMRGLMVEYPGDEECWVRTDQFLLGDALLCAPVLRKGERRREVYLPEGRWVDCWTGEEHPGARSVEVDAPLERWPVLQRAGTVVPMLLEVPLDLNAPAYASGDFDLELRIAPGGPGGARALFDGTVVTYTGDTVSIEGPRPRRYALATPEGELIAEGQGATLELPARA